MQEANAPSCQNPCNGYSTKACALCKTIDEIRQFCLDISDAAHTNEHLMGACWKSAVLAITDGIGDIIAEG